MTRIPSVHLGDLRQHVARAVHLFLALEFPGARSLIAVRSSAVNPPDFLSFALALPLDFLPLLVVLVVDFWAAFFGLIEAPDSYLNRDLAAVRLRAPQ